MRVARVARLITERPKLEAYFQTTGRLGPAVKRLISPIVLLFFVYGSLGEYLFGGLLYEGNPALLNTAFAQSNYYVINFNDFGNAMITMFSLLMVNNWMVLMEGCTLVYGHRLVRLFFISFHILAVWVIMGIFVAFIIETFIDTMEHLNGAEEEESEEEAEEEEQAACAIEEGESEHVAKHAKTYGTNSS